MTWADYAILGIILASALLGLVRGFLREVVSVLVWMVGFWLALRYSGMVSSRLGFVHDSTIRSVIGFGVIFVLILLVGLLLNYLLAKLVDLTGAGSGNRSLGFLFGAVRGMVIVTTLIVAGSMTMLPQHKWWQESRLIPYAKPLASLAQRFAAAPHFELLKQVQQQLAHPQPAEPQDP
jgi:membrane protein required for colicin V production